MSAKNRKPVTKLEVIVELWEQMGRESAGAAELELIQQGLAEHFGADATESPASIARILADHGARLEHPEILQADALWRERRQLFTFEDLNFGTLDAATALIEKIETLRGEFEGETAKFEGLRQQVRQIKTELELLATTREKGLAQEVAQWLAIWLQNPQIFGEWLALRRATAEFKDRFEQ